MAPCLSLVLALARFLLCCLDPSGAGASRTGATGDFSRTLIFLVLLPFLDTWMTELPDFPAAGQSRGTSTTQTPGKRRNTCCLQAHSSYEIPQACSCLANLKPRLRWRRQVIAQPGMLRCWVALESCLYLSWGLEQKTNSCTCLFQEFRC